MVPSNVDIAGRFAGALVFPSDNYSWNFSIDLDALPLKSNRLASAQAERACQQNHEIDARSCVLEKPLEPQLPYTFAQSWRLFAPLAIGAHALPSNALSHGSYNRHRFAFSLRSGKLSAYTETWIWYSPSLSVLPAVLKA